VSLFFLSFTREFMLQSTHGLRCTSVDTLSQDGNQHNRRKFILPGSLYAVNHSFLSHALHPPGFNLPNTRHICLDAGVLVLNGFHAKAAVADLAGPEFGFSRRQSIIAFTFMWVSLACFLQVPE
jgi:hypothetical protein